MIGYTNYVSSGSQDNATWVIIPTSDYFTQSADRPSVTVNGTSRTVYVEVNGVSLKILPKDLLALASYLLQAHMHLAGDTVVSS